MVESIRLLIELQPGTEPLSGCATVGDEEEHFVGWLALLQVLERAATGASTPPPLGSE